MEFLKAFAVHHRDGIVMQIHGFDGNKRATRAARDARAIISDGTVHPGDKLVGTLACLRDALGPGVKLYPSDVTELGGTRNLQGLWYRENSRGLFLHVELNLALRKLLRDDCSDATARAHFICSWRKRCDCCRN